VVWQKFIFISSLASLTCYYDCSIGPIMADPEKRSLMTSLLSEIISVAEKKKISLPPDLMQATEDKIAALPFDASSSMHGDFRKGKQTELESLTGYVISEAKAYNIDVPTYEMMYSSLKKRLNY
jgi:2-dehydropantoate 2-reductase